MAQTALVVEELKRALKAAGKTYADVAAHLGLSEASVKRLFQQQTFSLERLDQACELAGLQLSDLVERMSERRASFTEFTPKQETELLREPKLLVLTYLLLNGWEFDDIIETFQIEETEGFLLLRRLERLGMIEVLPFNKVKVLTARNFSWRKDGPVQAFFREQVQSEFFDSRFDQPGEDLKFVGALLSHNSMMEFQQRLEQLVSEFDELARRDAKRCSRDELHSCSAVLAIRPWEFSMFRQLKREQ